jgi:hypothetical protein
MYACAALGLYVVVVALVLVLVVVVSTQHCEFWQFHPLAQFWLCALGFKTPYPAQLASPV